MNIVGVTACTVGIAHTYIAQKKIETAAKKAGHNVKIETQGTIGIENQLTANEIAMADIVLLAADVGYFTGKRLQDSRGDDHHRTENNRPDGHHPSP